MAALVNICIQFALLAASYLVVLGDIGSDKKASEIGWDSFINVCRKIHRVMMEAACRNELKYGELRERCALYSAYYLPDEEIINRIAAQCKRDFSASLSVIGNDSGLINAAFIHEIYKTEVMKCCQPFEYTSMWQIQAIGAVIPRKIRSV